MASDEIVTMTQSELDRMLQEAEAQAWRDAAQMVENAGDYGYGGWHEADLQSAADRLRTRAEELEATD